MMFGDSINEKEAHMQLDIALENGINAFDTAEMYPVPQQEHTQGASERCLGEWMLGKDRSSLLVSTKVAGPGSMTWLRNGPSSLNGRNIRMAVEGSLSRLNTDYIDILHLHWPDRYVPMFGGTEFDCKNVYAFSSFEDQLEEVGKLYHEGKIRCFGLSNETPYGIMKYCSLAEQNSKFPKPMYLQNSFSLLCRTFLSSGVAECCYLEDIKLMAYSPLAMGLLSGKYLDKDSLDPKFRLVKFKGRYAEAESRYGPKPNVRKAVKAYVSLAKEFGMDPVELAIRFALSQPQVCTLVVGASSTDQLRLLIDYAVKGSLDAHVLSEIDAIHQRYPNPTP
jgi:N-acetyltransferase 10